MSQLTQAELQKLESIWQDVLAGKFKDKEMNIRPERLLAEEGRDFLSVPNAEGTARTVYERKEGDAWSVVPGPNLRSTFR